MTQYDILIVGAGVSGIGAAHHIQTRLPGASYAILEARERIGGTWDLFRYPGIRSDSDLHTFGYAHRPWTGDKAIADGPDIRHYIQDTARDEGIDRHIRFGLKVTGADWDRHAARWTVSAVDAHTDEPVTLTARWLLGAAGYYDYDKGFAPHFEGSDAFDGPIIHPQHWPEDLDYSDKRVIVIGSGATAVTLVPAMARTAAHVTMLQRSPSFILPAPAVDKLDHALRRRLPGRLAYAIVRRRNITRYRLIYGFSRRFPQRMRRFIRNVTARQLEGTGIDVDTHFNPRYDPWDQRLCVVPNSDLFRALRKGTASVETGRISTFTPEGIRLESGEELGADIIVTATGLNLRLMGGMALTVDSEPVDISKCLVYKGMMLSDVPNFAFAIGYTNISWTLKVDLIWEYLCRLVRHAEDNGYAGCVADRPSGAFEEKPLLDFQAGYVLRSLDSLPKQGPEAPWYLAQDYWKDRKYLRRGSLEDSAMRFFQPQPEPTADPVAAPAG